MTGSTTTTDSLSSRVPEPGIEAVRRVLVVDDDAAELARLAALLEARGLVVCCAADGAAGRRTAVEFRPDVVISDWCMPGMDGLQLCRALREDEHGQRAYIILVTGRGGDGDLVAGLEAGADDFVAKPYRANELLARVDAGRRLVLRSGSPGSSEALGARGASARSDRWRGELAAAAGLQARQVPARHALAGPFETGCLFRPAEDLAGDTFGYRLLPDGQLAFYLADVAGHGVSAALNAFALSRLLHAGSEAADLLCAAGRARSAAAVVAALNRTFSADEHCDQYFTMVYGTVDPVSGLGVLCQAGHPHPLVVSPHGVVRRLGAGGFPVGLMTEASYDEVAFRLAPGERLLVVSDGALDHRSPAGHSFGQQRLEHLLTHSCGEPLPQVLDTLESALDGWSGGRPREDDISLLCIGMPA